MRRVSAPALESLLSERLSRYAGKPVDIRQLVVAQTLQRVDVLPNSIVIEFSGTLLPLWGVDPEAAWASLLDVASADERFWRPSDSAGTIKGALEVRAQFSGGRTEFVGRVRSRSRRDPALIAALKKAHRGLENLVDGRDVQPIRTQYGRNLLALACLAPDIQQAILEGRQPASLTLQRLISGGVPCSWSAQRQTFELAD